MENITYTQYDDCFTPKVFIENSATFFFYLNCQQANTVSNQENDEDITAIVGIYHLICMYMYICCYVHVDFHKKKRERKKYRAVHACFACLSKNKCTRSGQFSNTYFSELQNQIRQKVGVITTQKETEIEKTRKLVN